VRVAEATGCAGVVLTSGSVDLHNPKTVRATAGAVFRVPAVESVEVAEVLRRCAERSVTTVATVGRGGDAPEDAPLDGAVALLIGAEAHGLPDDVVAACDARVSLPMEGGVESLNAAVAGSVLLFDAARRRRVGGQPTGGRSVQLGHNDPPMTEAPR